MAVKKKMLVTKSEFARKTGVTKGRISQLIKDGTLKETKDGRLDFDESMTRIKANRDPSRASKIIRDEEEEGIAHGFRRARTAREMYNARLAELEYKVKAGMLVDAKEVKSKLFELWRILRDAFQALPDRMAPVFAGETNIEKIRSEMKKEIDMAMEDFWKGASNVVVSEQSDR